jgi:hypothetical protein
MRDIFVRLRRGERTFDDASTAALLVRVINQTGHSVSSLSDFLGTEEHHFKECLCWECLQKTLQNLKVNSENFSV